MPENVLPDMGTIALLGSGEYLDVMNSVDMYLLETLGGVEQARVALIPTASGLEPDGPTYWNNLGVAHFKQLGVKDVRATTIIDPASAADPQQLALLEGANLYYFSGGNPQYTIDTLRNSQAWKIIQAAYEKGAVLAGCSAGAMMMGGQTIGLRQMATSQEIPFTEALGIVPRMIIFPHFDRMSRFLTQERFQAMLQHIPATYMAIGIDEDTALVRITADTKDGASLWRVMGSQTVTIYQHHREPHILRVGDKILL